MVQSASRPDAAARRARGAVTALFAVNGMTYASVVPWFPAIKGSLELSNAALGTAIAAMPLGALLTGMLAGPLIARFGSARTAVGSGLLTAAVPFAAAFAPNWWMLAAVLFWLGCCDAWADSAMNAHGVRVQRRYGRTIINAFHATWSIAAVTGGLAGAAAAGFGLPMPVHTAFVAATLIALCLLAARRVLPGPDDTDREGLADPAAPAGPGRLRRVPWRAVGLLAALGALLMMAGGVEDSAASWGAVYMRTELTATAFLAGLPFVACQSMMTLGRLVGDRLTDRFGPALVSRAGTLLAAGGLGVALLAPNQVTTIVGFGLSGLGVATLFPLALAAAGNVPGVRSGDGITVVSWLARAGFLAFPPLVGMIADAASLRAGLAVIPFAALAAFLLVGALRPRRPGDLD